MKTEVVNGDPQYVLTLSRDELVLLDTLLHGWTPRPEQVNTAEMIREEICSLRVDSGF